MLTKENLIGRWQLIAAEMTIADKMTDSFDPNREMIKHFTESGHFYFYSKTADRVPFSASVTDEERLAASKTLDTGGGRFTLEGETYTEWVEFCSYPNYEGKAISFSLSLDGDTLTQQGPYPLRMLGFAEQDGYVKEVYKRIEK
ncbi:MULTISPECIES: lipocalin-like domain-containing protein [Motilimonas]|uniref:Lipocalin-like domain-containing protein n=1 Tax=Motilimonas cestriensis TaxID=2742685 RepID=A0ABS8WEB3_9GAMM|nr:MULTISPECIES: lipocalin-like domain-containing protein [Motilimonas]MCE0557004.1 lipocalin-like domain-containing protein [Motilimonas sp. E26]MCE2596657.1 lipocalin-like domain-containing protein [Motilimonas cestriensis]MDO6527272.1 lipocalin-like domain-containing protein [Motilimonas sp. 1_MG-2023]